MFNEISQSIKRANKVIILPHENADGDCLGSAYALKLMLEHLGKEAYVILEEETSDIFSLLCGTEQAEITQWDTVIAVDCGDIFRLGSRMEIFNKCEETINIDHHDTNTKFAKYNYVDSHAAATGEIIFYLIEYMGISLTKAMANNLYIAISSDTGCFSYSSATANTYRIAAKLLETGINHSYINEVLYERKSLAQIRLIRDAYNSFEVFYEGKVAMVSVTKEQIMSSEAGAEESCGLTNIPRRLDTAEVAVSLRELADGNGVKVGFRSNKVNVAKIAAALGGGGHIKASGCTVKGSIDEVKQLVLQEISKAL